MERYDRARAGNRWLRIHQEDMCQALGLHPTRKYENDGGPGVQTIVALLREQSSSPEEDVQSFLDAIAFNWLAAGTDAHAKNYSLLLGQNGVVRLAPLYDLASILPYPSVDLAKVKLAMKIGGEYRLRNIGLRHWQRLAAAVRIDDANLIDRIRTMAQAMPDKATATLEQVESEGLTHVTITRLCNRLKTRAVACQAPATLQFQCPVARRMIAPYLTSTSGLCQTGPREPQVWRHKRLRKVCKKFLRRNRKRLGQLDDVFQRDVSFPAFNSPDVIAMQPSPLRQLLLRVPALVTEAGPGEGHGRCQRMLSPATILFRTQKRISLLRSRPQVCLKKAQLDGLSAE